MFKQHVLRTTTVRKTNSKTSQAEQAARLDTPSHGLSQPEAARRLEQYGYNELAEKRTILC
jgi:magnesium-transporting ATPase (P-type)